MSKRTTVPVSVGSWPMTLI